MVMTTITYDTAPPCSYPLEERQSSLWIFPDWICKIVGSNMHSIIKNYFSPEFEFISHFIILYTYLQARIEQWIDFASMEIDVNIFQWLLPRIGHIVYFPPVS